MNFYKIAKLLGVGNLLSSYFYQGINLLTEFNSKNLFSCVTIDNSNHAYYYFVRWLADLPEVKACNKTKAALVNNTGDYYDSDELKLLKFIPNISMLLVDLKEFKIVISKEIKEIPVSAYDVLNYRMGPSETFKVYCLNKDLERFKEIFEKACTLDKKDKKVEVYISSASEWESTGSDNYKRLDSVILKEGQSEAIVNDIETFYKNKDWYLSNGIPFRRGILLHGEPGTGKSSTALAIASHFSLDIYIINLNSGMDDRVLLTLMSKVSNKSLVLIEDIDTFLVAREAEDSGVKNDNVKVSLAGVLNAIDGITSSNGRLLCLTSNYKEKLDPALIRPGRVDFELEFTHANEYQIKSMFRKFYPNVSESLVDQFAAKVKNPITTSKIQGYLLGYRNNPEKAIEEYLD